AFVFDIDTDSLIGPVELLGGQTDFEAFAEEVLVQLDEQFMDEAWVEDGASPTPENYHTVLPMPNEDGGIAGYAVIFPPYQVACYACGTVEVFVPVHPLRVLTDG
ncbi:MAG: RsiV family protein, partial [Candidatus Fermentibacteria bacterium]